MTRCGVQTDGRKAHGEDAGYLHTYVGRVGLSGGGAVESHEMWTDHVDVHKSIEQVQVALSLTIVAVPPP